MSKQYRIQRLDDHNWTIEEYQEGGSTISRGRFAGQEMQAKWKAPTSFHRTLADAAKALLDKATGDAVASGEAASILDAIKLAEARVLAALPQEACKRCGSAIKDDRCQDKTCPFSDCSQSDPKGWAGHPDHQEVAR